MDTTRTVYRYDLAAHRVVASFPIPADAIRALSPDGRQLVVTGGSNFFDRAGGGRISVLDAANGHTIEVLPITTVNNDRSPYPAVVTGDGRWLAVVEAVAATPTDPNGQIPSSTLAVFDTSNYSRPPRLLRTDAPISQLAAGTNTLAVVTASGTISIVSAADFTVRQRGHRPELAKVHPASDTTYWWRLSPDAQQIALTEPGDATLPYMLDSQHLTGPLRPLARLDGEIASMSFSRTGQLLGLSITGGAVDVFRVSDGTLATQPLEPAPGQATYLAWAGTTTADTGLYAAGRDSHILSLDLHNGPRLVRTEGPAFEGMQAQLLAGAHVIAFLPPTDSSGSVVPVRITDINTGSAITTSMSVDPTESFQYVSADDAARRLLLVTQDANRIMRSNVFELPSGRLLNRFVTTGIPSVHNTDVGRIAPDGRTAVYAVAPHTLATFSLPDGRQLNKFDVRFGGPAADRHWVMPTGFSPDGNRLLVAGVDEVRPQAPPPDATTATSNATDTVPENQLEGVVDLHTRRLDGQVGGFGTQGLPSASAWSPDGSRVVLGTTSGTMRVVAARDLAAISTGVSAVVGELLSLSFSPDGKTIVSGGDSGVMAFWDAQTLRPIGSPIRATPPDAWWAWYRHDGSIAGYAPGPTGDSQQWFVMPGLPSQWLASACQLAGVTLSRDEWDRYIGTTRGYKDPC